MKIDTILERLREEVIGGGTDASGRLPTERVLAERLGVSRGTLRQALSRLEQEGAIWRGVGRGTYVRGKEPHRPAATAIVPDTTNPTEVMEARLVLEPQLAGMAALNATPAEIAALEGSIAAARRATGVLEFESLDSAFHRTLAGSVGNTLLLGLFDALNAARDGELWGRLKAASLTAQRMQDYCDHHQAIVDALRARDRVAAVEAMRTHLLAVRANLLGI